MILRFFNNQSADNTIGKTLVAGPTFNIFLKRSTDIIEPELTLEGDVSVMLGFNYASIDELNRSYFIEGVDNYAGNLWTVKLRCDVLQTYRDAIKSSHARYKRRVTGGDYFIDGLDTDANKTIRTYLSDVTLPQGVHTNILTVIEGGTV